MIKLNKFMLNLSSVNDTAQLKLRIKTKIIKSMS